VRDLREGIGDWKSRGSGDAADEMAAGAAPAADATVRRLASALHDLCQPLTALQCRLEIGSLMGTPEGHAEAVREGLKECERLMTRVKAMQAMVRIGLEGQGQ
jgi:signal transduction histidine kinase